MLEIDFLNLSKAIKKKENKLLTHHISEVKEMDNYESKDESLFVSTRFFAIILSCVMGIVQYITDDSHTRKCSFRKTKTYCTQHIPMQKPYMEFLSPSKI